MVVTAPSCELDVERGPDWLLVRVTNLDEAEADALQLAERLWRVLQQHFTYRLVLELDQVGLLSSPLISQLMQLHGRIEEHSGVMRVCGLSPENCEVLHTCRLDDRLTPYENRHAAIRGSGRPRLPR
jgi:anti-anti-sigma regulatory factor